ncbi:sensor domain-containing protein, partial [Mycobacteroides chelonae]|uniref:sensor domain-containing protein n=1 Tax=Mycobacteroides chelonae TaxID=1774 RepID=UPI001041C626
IVVTPRLDSDSGGDLDSPRVNHDLDDRMSEPCRAVLNQDNLFGMNWSSFKNRAYYGASNLGVSQSIAVYPDGAAAEETFERMKRNFNACAAKFPIETFGDAPRLSSPDARTLVARYPGSVNGPGSVMIYRVDSQVLIYVGAFHYSTDSDVAQTVLDRIEAKMNTPI